MNRRAQDIEQRPSGLLVDRSALRDLLASWDARAASERVTVRRLSKQDGPERLPEVAR